MKHQQEVLKSWEENRYFGLIIHATGSGKTITGVNAIKRWFESNNHAENIIVLSTRSLTFPANHLGYSRSGVPDGRRALVDTRTCQPASAIKTFKTESRAASAAHIFLVLVLAHYRLVVLHGSYLCITPD